MFVGRLVLAARGVECTNNISHNIGGSSCGSFGGSGARIKRYNSAVVSRYPSQFN